MKHHIQYIAFVLLAIFTVTFMPFNALHHHAKDEHAAITHAHYVDTNHHCELDDYVCQGGLDATCEHPSHIQKTIEKCFACEFHFIKHFETAKSIVALEQEDLPMLFKVFVSDKLHQANILFGNKGPPVLA